MCILVTAEVVKVGFVEVKSSLPLQNIFRGKKASIIIVWGCLFNTILLSAVSERFVRVQKQRTKPQNKSEVNAFCNGEYSRKVQINKNSLVIEIKV